MQQNSKVRKRLPAELQNELLSFLEVDEQRPILSVNSKIYGLIGQKVRRNWEAQKEREGNFALSMRRIMWQFPPSFFINLYENSELSIDVDDLWDLGKILHKADRLFGKYGENVCYKSLLDSRYANFLTKEYPKMSSTYPILKLLSSHYFPLHLHHEPIADDDLTDFLQLQNELKTVETDFERVHILCKELESHRLWEMKFNSPEAPCDIHLHAPTALIKHCSTDQYHHLCALCSLQAECLDGDSQQQCYFCKQKEKRIEEEKKLERPLFPCDFHHRAPSVQIHNCSADRYHHLCEKCVRQEGGEENIEETDDNQQQCRFCNKE